MRLRLLCNFAVGSMLASGLSCSADVREPADGFAVAVDEMEHQPIIYKGRVPLARMPLSVGQWAEYLVVEGSAEPSRIRWEVSGREGDSFLIVKTVDSAFGKRTVRFVAKTFRDGTPRKVEVPAAEIGTDSEKVGESPSAGDGRDYPRIPIGVECESQEVPSELEMSSEFLIENVRRRVSPDRTLTVTVPAGTFENTVKRCLTVEFPQEAILHEWLSSDVPISGIVKAETEDGPYRQVLVRFFVGGAK